MPELLPELWELVLAFIRKQRPAPTGHAKRAAIRQPALARMMQVSKQLNILTGPFLYTEVVSDHLPSLVYGYRNNAAVKGIRSKAQNLELIRRLFLEYCEKSEPTYTSLMRNGGKFFLLCGAEDDELTQLCGAEADWMAESAGQLKSVLRKLRTISTGAYLGGQREVWKPIWDAQVPHNMAERMKNARYTISSLVLPEQMPYICQRVTHGPLTYISQFWYYGLKPPRDWTGPRGIEQCLHIDGADVGYAPVIVGGKSRWYCTFKDVKTEEMDEASAGMVKALGSQTHVRSRCWPEVLERRTPATKTPLIEIDAYLPPRFMAPKIMNDFKANLEQTLETSTLLFNFSPPPGSVGDIRRWKKLKEAPPCEACDWTVRDL